MYPCQSNPKRTPFSPLCSRLHWLRPRYRPRSEIQEGSPRSNSASIPFSVRFTGQVGLVLRTLVLSRQLAAFAEDRLPLGAFVTTVFRGLTYQVASVHELFLLFT